MREKVREPMLEALLPHVDQVWCTSGLTSDRFEALPPWPERLLPLERINAWNASVGAFPWESRQTWEVLTGQTGAVTVEIRAPCYDPFGPCAWRVRNANDPDFHVAVLEFFSFRHCVIT